MEQATHLLAFVSSAAFPVAAPDLMGTLRAQGTVMVSTGGDFVRAVDGQPVAAGMRLMVGDDGSATVDYAPVCKRSYPDAGTYMIVPARCDNDRKQDDRSREEDARRGGTRAQARQDLGAAGNGSPWTALDVVVGAAVAGAAATGRMGESVPPGHPVSR